MLDSRRDMEDILNYIRGRVSVNGVYCTLIGQRYSDEGCWN